MYKDRMEMLVKKFWMGANPGGKGNFGLAFLDTTGKRLRCATVSSVDEAVELITSTGIPLGLGIDAPMWWSSCEGAGRKVDKSIREKYGIHPGKIQSANSLRGAALVGGAMLAFRIRQKFPDTRITETHPKALLCALKIDGASFAKRFGISPDWKDEHQRDAAIGAVCAREGFERRWLSDLALQRNHSEQDPFSYWLAPMHYFWPESL